MAKNKSGAKTAAPVEAAHTITEGDEPVQTPESGDAPVEDAATDASAAPATAIPRTRGPRGTKESDVITVVFAGNPKRGGSKAHAAFACYQNGMTIAEFCDAVDALGDGHKATATGHLVYDTKHNFISIEGYKVPGGVLAPKEPRVAKPKAEKAPKASGAKAPTSAAPEGVEASAEAKANAERLASEVQAATVEESIE